MDRNMINGKIIGTIIYSDSQEGRVYILAHFQAYPLLNILYGVPVSLTGVKVNSSKIDNLKITLFLGKY